MDNKNADNNASYGADISIFVLFFVLSDFPSTIWGSLISFYSVSKFCVVKQKMFKDF